MKYVQDIYLGNNSDQSEITMVDLATEKRDLTTRGEHSPSLSTRYFTSLAEYFYAVIVN